MRQVLIDQDYSGRDLRGIDGTDAYALRCNFQGARFGVITNAAFIDCDLRGAILTDAKYTGVSVDGCQLAGIVLPTLADMVAEWRGKPPCFDHIFMAMLFTKASEAMTGALRTAFRQMATDLIENRGLCFAEFVKLWCDRWAPMETHTLKVKQAMSTHPRLRAIWRQYGVPIVATYYPGVPPEYWE